MKPRVLQLIDSFREGGSERQATQLTRLLVESGRYSVSVASLNSDGPLRSDLEELGIGQTQCYPLGSFFDRNALVQLRRMVTFLRAQKIDIVHSHCFYTNVFGMAAAALARVPVRIASRRESSKRAAMKRRLERLTYRFAHRVIANCDEVRLQLVDEGVAAEKIVTLYNGLDLERVEPETMLTREAALAALGLPLEGPRRFVTIVANLREVKDHATFLRSAQRVRAAVPNAAFIVAGDGPLAESTRAFAANLGLNNDTFFLGRCDRLAQLLQVSDVCVLSSKSEGFSNSILEYMAARRPVVATDVGGVREAVEDGETGYLVPSGDDQSMAACIIYLLSEPEHARVMGERGREIVERRFSSQNRLAQTERLYAQLIMPPTRAEGVPTESERRLWTGGEPR